MDVHPKNAAPNEAYFLLNNNKSINPNGSNDGAAQGVSTPTPANHPACEMEEMPVGENYSPHSYQSVLTNEVYDWVLNNNGANFIKRLNSKGECEIVYFGPCLPLSADPKHQITQFRAKLKLEKLCANRDGKALMWTDGLNPIGYIDTEASIATSFFTTPFFDRCRNDCAYVQMCVPEICGCIAGEFVLLPLSEVSLTNQMVDKPIQIAIRHVYYDRRASEWSDWTKTFFQDSKGCFDSSAGFSRCLKLRLPVGNPLVEKIEVAFTLDGGKTWALYDTIEKYKKYNSQQEKWYERELSEIVASTFSDEDCSFDYYFCNDKQCQSLDRKEFHRVRNPIPQQPQGILDIKDAEGFYNYVDGNCPLDKFESEKLNIDIDCTKENCIPEMVTVKVRAIVHNVTEGHNAFIWRFNGTLGDPDDKTEPAYFGGITMVGGAVVFTNNYLQDFKEKTRNFIAYIDGVGYSVEMKQKLGTADPANAIEYGVVANADEDENAQGLSQDSCFFQEAKIRVPKGTKGFIRLTSHKETTANENTSTQVFGTIPDIRNYYSGDIFGQIYNANREEIYFDTCDGDVDLKEAFLIMDNAVPPNNGQHSNLSYSGYIRDNFGQPIEGAEIIVFTDSDSFAVDITDHNGFYNFSLRGDVHATSAGIYLEKDCTYQQIKDFNLANNDRAATERDYVITNDQFNTNFFTTAKVTVVDCNGVGVGGLIIAMSGSKHRTTDATGVATFKLHNYPSRNRVVRAVLMNKNGCITTDCNGNCDSCMPSVSHSMPTCFTGTIVQIGTFTVNRESLVSKKGLKAGGRYPFAYVVQGDCGLLSAAYEIKYIDIPKTQEKGKVSFCSFNYDATGMQLPAWGKCLKILRGINLNPFELQWIVDKIQRTPDGKIKLTIQSLNDYNAKYFGKTNTVYNWLKGDRVEFIRNGNSSIFTTGQYGLLNYLTLSPFHDSQISGNTTATADYFNQLLIEDDGKLNELKEGAIIEIQRPKDCQTDEPPYYEMGVSIPLIQVGDHTELAYPIGTFETYDTYLVNRSAGEFGAMIFEHFSPSDFWGEKLDGRAVDDLGKVHFANKYENQKRFGRNISINSASQPNYFGDLIKKFDAPGQGDIIAMNISDGKIIQALCEHDNFIAQAADELVRVGTDGIIRALPPDAIISEGQPKLYGQYGCQYPHIGSIFFGDGWTTFVDVNKHRYIVHNYQNAKVCGEKVDETGNIASQCNTYFEKRCQEIETFNQSEPDFYNHFRFATGYNKANGFVYLTIKSLRHPAINNELGPYLKPNETIIYEPTTDNFRGFASFTPEGYSNLNLFDGQGCAFLTFFSGLSYIHPILSNKSDEFYGIGCDWVYGFVLNKLPNKIKTPLSVEIQTHGPAWYAKDIRTEMANFRSEIPVIKVKRHEQKWNAPVLGNANSREGLHKSSELPRGYYVKFLFIRDNTKDLLYNSTDDNKRTQYSEIDGILVKFLVSEQSGFTENL